MASSFIYRCILTLLSLNIVLVHNVASGDSLSIEKYHSKVDIDSVDSSDVLDTSIETDEFIFGSCQPTNDNCRNCYLTLVKELFGNAENVLNLSLAFTAPVQDEPNSVIVTYHITNNSINANATWFWAKSGAYFLHPLFVFQFISLLFGNPRPLYEREVDVTLNATKCYGVEENHDFMTLLTQRLKLHVQQQSIYPKIPDFYMPTAVSNDTFENMINSVTNRPISNIQVSARILLRDCPIMITTFTTILVIIVLVIYACDGKLKEREHSLKEQTKATIVSIAFVSFVRIVIFLGLDSEAIKYRRQHQDSKVTAIYNAEIMKEIYNTPWILLAIDIIALFFHVSLILFLPGLYALSKCYTKFKIKFCNATSNDAHNGTGKIQYYYCICVSLTVVPLIISGLNHAPYIIMAYVSDANFASSIFLYYMIALFLEFGLLQFTFKTLYFNNPTISSEKCCKYGYFCLMIFLLAPILSILINGLMATTFLYLFFMPIKYVLSNAPSQVLVVYHSAVLLVGAYITYKAVFKDDHNQQKVEVRFDINYTKESSNGGEMRKGNATINWSHTKSFVPKTTQTAVHIIN